MIMEKYIYELEMKVRDYECDLQGGATDGKVRVLR